MLKSGDRKGFIDSAISSFRLYHPKTETTPESEEDKILQEARLAVVGINDLNMLETDNSQTEKRKIKSTHTKGWER